MSIITKFHSGGLIVSDELVAKNIELNAKRGKRPIYALSLDGASSVRVEDADSLDTGACSMIATIKINGGSGIGAGTGIIYQKTSQYSLRCRPDLVIIHADTWNNLNVIKYRYTTNNQNYLGKITRIAATYAGGANNPIIYKNGVSQGTSGDNLDGQAPAYTTPFLIGFDGSDGYYTGLIYNVAHFSTVLTPTQVANLSTGILSPKDIPGCVLYHDYTTGSAQDLSGNGNHGTLMGNAQFIITGYD